jgi:hypothetical protein
MEIWILYAIYEIVHGSNFLTCNELFAIGKFIVWLV